MSSTASTATTRSRSLRAKSKLHLCRTTIASEAQQSRSRRRPTSLWIATSLRSSRFHSNAVCPGVPILKFCAPSQGPRPCNSLSASSGIVGGADAGGTPARRSVCPSTSNSRLGRKSPVAQGMGRVETMEARYVGVDVSKDRLDVHVLPEGAAFAVARDGKGLAELVERLSALQPQRIAVEATGGFETIVAAALAGASLPLVIVNPAQVRHFAQALGRRAKTDPIDASMIARFVEATKPDLHPLADEAAQLLADLVARRRQIIEMIVAERNRERRVHFKRIHKSIVRLIAALEKELSEIDAEIDASVRGSPAWREKEDLFASVPGVGPITARALIAELPELGTLDGKRIASLAGLAPFTRQSGQWKGKAMIAGGRKSVRSALFLASLPACRHNPVLKAFRQRLIDAGKPKMLVAIAAARKLLTILNAILRDKQPWRPETA